MKARTNATNGATDFELRMRKVIRELIEAGRYTEARERSKKFIETKWRSRFRVSLLHTVKYWPSVMNRDPELMKRERVD